MGCGSISIGMCGQDMWWVRKEKQKDTAYKNLFLLVKVSASECLPALVFF